MKNRGLVPWIVYVVFFSLLNETVFNVSTPKIAAQYGLNSAGVSWVITVFIITFGALIGQLFNPVNGSRFSVHFLKV